MPGGQARMIQMLAALSQIQLQRREQDRLDKQAEDQKKQFAARLGFDEKSEHFKQIVQLLDKSSESASASRGALAQLGQALGMTGPELESFQAFGQSAPESVDMLRRTAATQGYNNATPADQGQMNRNAAFGATTGSLAGQVSQSDLIGMLSGGPTPQQLQQQFTPQVTQALIQGFAQRAATGQTQLQAAGDQALMPRAGQVAAIANGLQTSAAQNQQAGLQQQQITQQGRLGEGNIAADYYRTNAQLITSSGELMAKLATAKSMGGITPEARNQAHQQMHTIVEAMQKDKNPNTRKFNMAIYNRLASELDEPQMTDPDAAPGQPSMMNNIGGALQTPGPAAPPQSIQAGPTPGAMFGQPNAQQQMMLQLMMRGGLSGQQQPPTQPMFNPLQQFIRP